MKNDSYIGFFGNFTSPSKLRILLSLVDTPLSVSQICDMTGVEQSNVSHHLSVLSECGLVSGTQIGRARVYALNKKTVLPLLHIAQAHTGQCPDTCKKECVVR